MLKKMKCIVNDGHDHIFYMTTTQNSGTKFQDKLKKPAIFIMLQFPLIIPNQ